MYLSDTATFLRRRSDGVRDAYGQLGETETRVTVYCRVWGKREGRREGVEAITKSSASIVLEGYIIFVPIGTDVEERDVVVSIVSGGRDLIKGGGPLATPDKRLEVRAIQEHRRIREVFCEVVR